VIDQIAAGEVVERPASVVKELVDNALDAGAHTITVETQAGGRALIRVSDDGRGMTADEAHLALQRHATSKLTSVDDLWGLDTMGFRGEALPAIASVATLTLTTRPAGAIAATRIVVTAGKVTDVSEVGAPVGTTIEIADLFANVPARLKFLKGDATEASHITDLVARLAMSHPSLHLRLKHNGRTALEVPPDRDGFSRAQALLGTRIGARMVAVSGEEDGVHVVAYLGAPELAQATARGVQLFVGRRPVRDRGLLHAIAMGYGELVPRGRYPIAVVMVDVPAGAVDVNVHPQKQEVRFSDAALVASAVRHVVQAGVGSAAWRAELGGPLQMTALTSIAPPRLPLDGQPATALSQRYAQSLREQMEWRPGRDAPQGELGFDSTVDPRIAGPRAWAEDIQRDVRASRAAERAEDGAVRRAEAKYARTNPPRTGEAADDGVRAASESEFVPTTFFSSLKYLGQLDLTYLVCDGDGELVLIDQHAAHERVELERLRAGDSTRVVPVQKLLFPITVDVTPAEVAQVSHPLLQQSLLRVGFEVEPFGEATLAVRAVPANTRERDPADLLRTLLAAWAEEGAPTEEERVERLLAELACHSVVRAGDSLEPHEAEALLEELDRVPDAARGPHGGPVLLRLPLAELARRFGR
jgi:DNA mismatch repair protein MutL